MAIELQILVWAVGLTLAQALLPVIGAFFKVGLPELAGNREGFSDLAGWTGRASRTHRNILENMVPFSALVLIGALTNSLNEITALGAQIFFGARVAYVFVYVGGIPWLRTGVWAVSLAGIALIFLQLI